MINGTVLQNAIVPPGMRELLLMAMTIGFIVAESKQLSYFLPKKGHFITDCRQPSSFCYPGKHLVKRFHCH